MLMVEHKISQSQIHGLGVFALEKVKLGQCVWQFNAIVDLRIPFDELQRLPAHVSRKICNHAEFRADLGMFILGTDGDYFMNHADVPNLHDGGNEMFAARDIQIGEELTCDYRTVTVLAFNPDHIQENRPASNLGSETTDRVIIPFRTAKHWS